MSLVLRKKPHVADSVLGPVTHTAVATQTELTLMAVPDRNISLPTLRKNVEERMLQNLEMLAKAQKGKDASVHPDERGALKQLCDVYLDSKALPSATHKQQLYVVFEAA